MKTLVAIAFCLLATGAAHGQKRRSAKEPHKSHLEYSLDTVMQRIDDLYETLNNINLFQQRRFDTASIRRQLTGISATLDRIREDLTNNTVTEYKKVLLDEYVLQDIRGQLQLWRNELFGYNNNLVKMNAEIEAFTRDSVLRQLITDSIYREMYLDELSQLRQKWKSARRNTDTSLVRVNALQSAISKPWFETLDLITEVTIVKGQIAGVLFEKEYPYIWEADTASANQISSIEARSFRSESGLAGYFWQRNWGYYVYALVIGILFFYWVWNNYRKIVTDDQGRAGVRDLHLFYIRPVPVLSSLVIILTILPFFNFNAPTSFTQLGQFLLVIVVSILFWLQWPRRTFRYWIYIVLLYILFVGTGAALVPRLGARIWLLALAIGSIFLVRTSLRHIREIFPYPRLIRIAWWIFLVLDLLTILSNILGRLSLSKILITTAIFSLVQIILLSVFVDCIVEALQVQTLKSRLRDSSDHKMANRAALFGKMQTSVYRLLAAIAVLTWAMAFSINLNIYDPAYAMAVRVWNHTMKLGSLEFRIGNVLLFILVLYLSNQLQKYIGFLYGSDDQSAQPSHKGSRLVMFRLILIIAGFLIAIFASGLPIDRITIVLGALGVGIGLGLQNIVNNLVSGIILIFERPFQIGDYIELNGKKGVVRDIGIRSSKMMTEDGTEIIMPNGDLLSGEVINWTVRNNQLRIELPMTVQAGPGASFEEISAIVTDALKDHPDLSHEDKPRVLLNSANDKTVSFTVMVYVGNIGQIQTIKSEIIRLLIGKLAEHQIKTV